MTFDKITAISVGADLSALIRLFHIVTQSTLCLSSKSFSPLVILREAKDLSRGAEMLRCTQHDNGVPDNR
jgi:hypothetical protein